jgi:ABC-type sugar transport system ATPase subunit
VATERHEGATPATVYVSELMGNETFVFLKVGAEKIIARTNPDVRLDMEANVWISFNERKRHFFDAVSGERIV